MFADVKNEKLNKGRRKKIQKKSKRVDMNINTSMTLFFNILINLGSVQMNWTVLKTITGIQYKLCLFCIKIEF